MAIVRQKAKRYTILPHCVTEDERLTLKDVGLLARLLALPDNWEFSENGLDKTFKGDGITSIRTGLDHLESYGYLKRTRARAADGTLGAAEWFVYDSPILENPILEKPILENHTQSNTKSSNTKRTSTYPVKKAYGEYGNVKLTEAQHDKLLKDLGEDTFENLLKNLDEYLQYTGKKYADYNLVMRKAHREGWFNRQQKLQGYNNAKPPKPMDSRKVTDDEFRDGYFADIMSRERSN